MSELCEAFEKCLHISKGDLELVSSFSSQQNDNPFEKTLVPYKKNEIRGPSPFGKTLVPYKKNEMRGASPFGKTLVPYKKNEIRGTSPLEKTLIPRKEKETRGTSPFEKTLVPQKKNEMRRSSRFHPTGMRAHSNVRNRTLVDKIEEYTDNLLSNCLHYNVTDVSITVTNISKVSIHRK